MSLNNDKINNQTAILQAANQQLKALNLQLAATEQQLRAANLQLKADEQQLKAANQQLKAGEQQLKAANQQLKAEQLALSQRKTELRRQYNILRTLIDNLPDLIYVKDAQCRFIVVNTPLVKHMAAQTHASCIGKTDYDFYPNALASKFFIDEQNILKTGQPFINIEEQNIGKKGNTLWFSTSKIPLKNDNGNIIGIVGISRDITERKQFEHQLVVTNQDLVANKQQLQAANQQLTASHQQLLAANQQLRASQQQLRANDQQLRAVNQQLIAAEKELSVLAKFPAENPNPVIRVTIDGNIQYANKNSQQLLAFWKTAQGKKLPKKWIDFAKSVLLAGANRYTEFEHADQTFALTFAPIPEAGYLNIYGHDISQRRKIEKLLQESHDLLEQRVKERTIELENANKNLLTEAAERKKAEENIREHQEKLRILASQLSLSEERQRKQIAETLHDDAIQTLVFLKMKINDLQELEASKGTKDFSSTLDQLNQQTSDLIQRMRTLTFDLGSPILYDLGLAAAIKDWLTREIGEKHNIATSFKSDHFEKQMNNDLNALLFRAVRELLANVVKHAKAKNIKISKIRQAGDIVITVEDDGVGFNPSNEFKYDVTTGGFGLFTIYERLSHYNGKLFIDSKPGLGTKVTLTAPLKFKD